MLERRSIRSYRTEQIKEADLKLILKAGQYAATGRGKQPWHFTVVQNDILIDDIAETCKEMLLASKNPFHNQIAAFHTLPPCP
ncbi:nitroreductase family protein [endosymbiont 'TC1' of Trimyema compressum]|uniref:nitroreductase family protein n=1 Tax=endosymbiont 'TC1' of Trimyema compressum TaxID=243899 RepID=UPI000B4C5B0E